MHTANEIEHQLAEAAKRMRLVSKAAQDQAARNTGEPAETPAAPLGEVSEAADITIKPQGQNLP